MSRANIYLNRLRKYWAEYALLDPFIRPVAVEYRGSVSAYTGGLDLKALAESVPAGVDGASVISLAMTAFRPELADVPDGAPPADGPLGAWVDCGIAAQGPKVFCPTAREWEALAAVEIRVPLADYAQPFETMIVTVPEELYPNSLGPQFGRPICVAARFRRDETGGAVLNATVHGDVQTVRLSWRLMWLASEQDQLIEDRLGEVRGLDIAGDPNAVTDRSEWDLIEVTKRVLMNACLLMVDQGFKVRGFENPGHAARLIDRSKKKNLPAKIQRQNESDLKACPVVLAFDQHIKVYEVQKEPAAGGGSGAHVRPHWRKGHWAQQAHGVGLAQRKRLYRPAVLVNAHLFGGKLGDTRVTITG